LRVSVLVSDRPRTTLGLAEFCHRVGDLVSSLPKPALPARVAALLPTLLANRDLLTPAQRGVPAKGYGRHDIFICPNQAFSVLAAVWPPGIATPIHDHRSWCAFGVYEGAMRETRYAPTGAGDHCGATAIEAVDCPAGAARFLPMDRPDIHAMHNPTDRVAISIHVYGEDSSALGPNVAKVYSPRP
jgi:predicted metal-dependent enzyme (double-stranded beta helix superfamily)